MKITDDMIEIAAQALASAQNIVPDITHDERVNNTPRDGGFGILRTCMGRGVTEWHRAVAAEVLESVLRTLP